MVPLRECPGGNDERAGAQYCQLADEPGNVARPTSYGIGPGVNLRIPGERVSQLRRNGSASSTDYPAETGAR